ncbi:ornithine cyclodeaminase family protein [Mycolicibacterium aichiense]|uniref:ornithine cyclodeaminase family protein n=1 Tax=Mycolicibacterium aichiense TaxID=1799 RepID=UPI003D6782B0
MTLVLTHSEIVGLLDPDQIRKAIEEAFAGLTLGDYQNPAPSAVPLPDRGLCLPMVAAGTDLTTVKLLSDVPANRDRDLPTQRSTIMVASAVTGECLAILDGRAITAVRTAAASAVATDQLAAESASVLGLVGAGNLAVQHASSIAAVRGLTRIVVWSRSADTLATFRARTENLGIPVESAPAPVDVFRLADVVCTLTPAKDPVARGRWFRPGQHINAVGAPPRPDHREIDADGMARSRLIVDSIPTVLAKSGAVLCAIDEGAITANDVGTELGDVITGRASGRQSDADISLFESVGIGLQDLVTARLVIDRAEELGVGAYFDLRA